jgi:hypothetical protein
MHAFSTSQNQASPLTLKSTWLRSLLALYHESWHTMCVPIIVYRMKSLRKLLRTAFCTSSTLIPFTLAMAAALNETFQGTFRSFYIEDHVTCQHDLLCSLTLSGPWYGESEITMNNLDTETKYRKCYHAKQTCFC